MPLQATGSSYLRATQRLAGICRDELTVGGRPGGLADGDGGGLPEFGSCAFPFETAGILAKRHAFVMTARKRLRADGTRREMARVISCVLAVAVNDLSV